MKARVVLRKHIHIKNALIELLPSEHPVSAREVQSFLHAAYMNKQAYSRKQISKKEYIRRTFVWNQEIQLFWLEAKVGK